jgi:hypothetical protein
MHVKHAPDARRLQDSVHVGIDACEARTGCKADTGQWRVKPAIAERSRKELFGRGGTDSCAPLRGTA